MGIPLEDDLVGCMVPILPEIARAIIDVEIRNLNFSGRPTKEQYQALVKVLRMKIMAMAGAETATQAYEQMVKVIISNNSIEG